MPITGSQKALTYSLSGVMRAGASRSGYFRAIAAMSLGGVMITRAIKPSIEIVDELNAVPNTATVSVRGSSTFTPTKGKEIIIGLGNVTNRIFAGHVLTVQQGQPRRDQKHPTFDLECIDYSWQLDWKRVQGKSWTAASPTLIISDILTAFAPAFTVRVEPGLPTVTFQSNHDERVSEALSRLMSMLGGNWYVDYDRIVHAFVAAEPGAPTPDLTSSNAHFEQFTYAEDVTQAFSRVRVTGGSSTTTTTAAVGATTLAVDDTRLFGTAGGYVLVGANQLTYTGKSTTEGAGSLTGIPAGGTGAILVSIAQGESVRVLAIAQDAAAAAALATLVGTGDGYIEHSVEDGQLGDAAARTRANGVLTSNTNTDKTDKRITYQTRDLFTRSGATVGVNLTNASTGQAITGTFQVQRVRITEVELALTKYPMRLVEAGSNHQDAFALLNGVLEGS